ncbi:hypothetical protein AC579_9577 [Pseudocercospora musae]|uniref:Uncharacterized protein n=1 Tax=Pseudocercospora musae TaxID=113226 RepID=A0A139IIA1_9PEZI|nr:hypothetical protein AC579_9577 [Pseudocercospora musae]
MPTVKERCIQSLAYNLSIWERENHTIEHAVIADSGTSQILLICVCDGEEDFEKISASKTFEANGVTYDITGTITREVAQETGRDMFVIELEKESVPRQVFDASYRLKNQPKYYSRVTMRHMEELEGKVGELELLKKEKKRAKRQRQRQKAKKVGRYLEWETSIMATADVGQRGSENLEDYVEMSQSPSRQRGLNQ